MEQQLRQDFKRAEAPERKKEIQGDTRLLCGDGEHWVYDGPSMKHLDAVTH